jgi:hypothetical protein
VDSRPQGPVERRWSKACQPRRGPPCAERQSAGWRLHPQVRLGAGAHAQVLRTLPRARQDWGLAKVAAMPTRRCARGPDTGLERLGGPASRGTTPGLSAPEDRRRDHEPG